jgi:acyl-CoA synthetase (AMP-forming)/AMP-acid ligase II
MPCQVLMSFEGIALQRSYQIPELLATYWACAKLGAAAVPLSPLLLAEGLVSLLNDAKPRVVVGTGELSAVLTEVRPRLAYAPAPSFVLTDGQGLELSNFASLAATASDTEPNAAVEAGDLMTVMYTSGTTGLPKGIMHTHFLRAMYAGLMASTWRMAPRASSSTPGRSCSPHHGRAPVAPAVTRQAAGAKNQASFYQRAKDAKLLILLCSKARAGYACQKYPLPMSHADPLSRLVNTDRRRHAHHRRNRAWLGTRGQCGRGGTTHVKGSLR